MSKLSLKTQPALIAFVSIASLLGLAACSSSSTSITQDNSAVAQDNSAVAQDNPTVAQDNSAVAQDGNTSGTDQSADIQDTNNNGPATPPTDSPRAPNVDDFVTSVNTGVSIPPNLVLDPLPSTPLTTPPGPESIPVVAEPRTTNIVGYTAMRDAFGNVIDVNDGLNEDDFAAGLPAAIITTPDDVDTATNAPPFFVNLDNVEVFAGQELVVVFDPDDPEGELPGMFSGSTPEGGSFDDNFDGTKSLRWRPLEPDVGIHEFTVTAIDPLVPLYRTEQTIRIKVKLPNDLSTIRNLAPGINLIKPQTVRVNDPVVAYIKVTDPNGTNPLLDIVNPPAGSTITAHPTEPNVTILHFIPDAPANLVLELRAIDSVDASLTATQSVSIDVLATTDFIRPGAPLRELAAARDLLFGYAALQSYYEKPDGALYADIAGQEFNIVSTENSIKFDYVNPLPGLFRWAATDNLVQLANLQNQTVHGHTLVWYTQLPGWVHRSELDDRELIMREFIDRVLQRYGADIPLWDVVNESLEDDGTLRNSVWHQAMGASYIDIAFRQARESAPDAVLLYNDYDISFNGPKSDAMINLMQQLKDAGSPVDGVGFQMHLFADFDKIDEVETIFQTVADMDLDIYITELDVSMTDGQTLEDQAQLYQRVLSACLNQPRCKAFQAWGFTDSYSWRSQFDPLLFDRRYQNKPAYSALQQRLSEN